MKVLFRVLVTLVSGVAAFYFVFWVGGALLLGLRWSPWISLVASLVVAAMVGRYVWGHTASFPAGLISSIALGAIATGGVGFVAGFFGPIIFTPGANQGPLLGIFITGPLGFILGAAGGAIHWLGRGRRRASNIRRSEAG
jgi:hypothetical protein